MHAPISKSLLALAAAIISQPSLASQIGCETQIEIAVRQQLIEANKQNEQVAQMEIVTSERAFENHVVYRVKADSLSALPSHSTWLVVAERGPMGTCKVHKPIMDAEVQ
ncbi:MAG: hypothetical protein AB7G93_19950 [Bdellovibrionales bacterium]